MGEENMGQDPEREVETEIAPIKSSENVEEIEKLKEIDRQIQKVAAHLQEQIDQLDKLKEEAKEEAQLKMDRIRKGIQENLEK